MKPKLLELLTKARPLRRRVLRSVRRVVALFDIQDLAAVLERVIQAALVVGAAATLGTAVRVFIWTSGLGG